MFHLLAVPLSFILAAAPVGEDAAKAKPFVIEVVDEQTGRGVPLVELRTVHDVRYVTDNAGLVAFHEPGLMDQKVFFFVSSHGYEFAKDGFGFRGRSLEVAPGGTAKLKIKRINIAERLYRVTGAGLYRDSVLAGRDAPLEKPILNGGVLGSDSVLTAVHSGKVHWFWGDTNRASYPLGNYHVPGAVSKLPGQGGLDPARGVNLSYFEDEKGLAKQTAKMEGEGPTWLTGLAVLKDRSGQDRLLASYMKVRGQLDVYRRGLVEFDDKKQEFVSVLTFDKDAPLFPNGHTFLHTVEGVEYLYFADPYPHLRVQATAEDYKNLAAYEAFTCLKPGATFEKGKLDAEQLDRDEKGVLRYGWKKGTAAIDAVEQARLVKSGLLKADEGWLQLADVESGKSIALHRGSVNWNAYRKRWIMIAVEIGGTTSHLGEVWYSEAESPEGPWRLAKKIITHDKYSFYNPKQHAFFDQEGGRVIYFEGTYTQSFSGNTNPTPRYEYNQMMYRLDLADPRLKLSK